MRPIPTLPQMPRPFPPELSDRVIDEVWYDVDTLRACSLVCRAWRPRSQLNLLNPVLIGNDETATKFKQALDRLPRLATFVHELCLQDTFEHGRKWLSRSTNVHAALGRCVRVRNLSLNEIDHNTVVELGIWPSTFPALKTLRIQGMSCRELADFTSLLSRVPGVVDVMLSRLAFERVGKTWAEGVPEDEQLPFKLQRLTIRETFVASHEPADFVSLGERLARLLPEVNSVDSMVYSGEDFASLGGLVKTLGPGLRHLGIDTEYWDVDGYVNGKRA